MRWLEPGGEWEDRTELAHFMHSVKQMHRNPSRWQQYKDMMKVSDTGYPRHITIHVIRHSIKAWKEKRQKRGKEREKRGSDSDRERGGESRREERDRFSRDS